MHATPSPTRTHSSKCQTQKGRWGRAERRSHLKPPDAVVRVGGADSGGRASQEVLSQRRKACGPGGVAMEASMGAMVTLVVDMEVVLPFMGVVLTLWEAVLTRTGGQEAKKKALLKGLSLDGCTVTVSLSRSGAR
eukprot:1905017-Rhodomonas_salina.1